MAKQRIVPGGEIDAVTLEELAEIIGRRSPNIVLGLGGTPDVERMNEDSPMKGTIRQVTSYNRGNGGDNFILPAAAFTQLCDSDGARVCGTIQNIGANPVYTYLCPPSRLRALNFGAVNGIMVGYLAANGGEWDFKLTNDVWCGPVTLYSTLGSTLVWGVH